MKPLLLLLVLVLLVNAVLATATSHSASIDVTYLPCDGYAAKLENGSYACIKCKLPTQLNNQTLKCEVPGGVAKKNPSGGNILNQLTPEAPGLATILLWIGGLFVAFKLLKR